MYIYVIKLVKRIIFSSFLLYGYNTIIGPLNFIIPINVVTIVSISLFGIPALLSLIFVYLVIF